MQLYRFLKAQHGLMSLRDRRLRIGRFEELNHDFEFIGLALGEKVRPDRDAGHVPSHGQQERYPMHQQGVGRSPHVGALCRQS